MHTVCNSSSYCTVDHTSPHASDTLGLDDFCLRGALGTGGTSQVLLVQRKGTAGYFALKAIPKAGMDAAQTARVVNENKLLQHLAHPYLVRLLSAFQDAAHFYLVLDYYGAGDLATWLELHGCIDEAGAGLVLGGMVLALRHLHENHNIIYRDLKPDNIVIDHRDGLPALADFGTAKRMLPGLTKPGGELPAAATHTHVGTTFYMAPEQWSVSAQGYGFSVDWWACGIVLFEMLLGDVPWSEGGEPTGTTTPLLGPKLQAGA